MIEVSIIVELRETAGGKKGRSAVGFARLTAANFTERGAWARYFFGALDRAIAKRRAHLEEARQSACRSPGPLFEEPF